MIDDELLASIKDKLDKEGIITQLQSQLRCAAYTSVLTDRTFCDIHVTRQQITDEEFEEARGLLPWLSMKFPFTAKVLEAEIGKYDTRSSKPFNMKPKKQVIYYADSNTTPSMMTGKLVFSKKPANEEDDSDFLERTDDELLGLSEGTL